MKVWVTHVFLAALAVYVLSGPLGLFEVNAFNALGIFLIIFTALWLSSVLYSRSYFNRIPKVGELFAYFMKEWVVSILKVAQEIMTKKIYMNPAVIAVPLEELTDFELTFIVNAIILTPGTLSIDLTDDNRVLYVHTFFVSPGGKEEFVRNIQEGFQNRLLAVTR